MVDKEQVDLLAFGVHPDDVEIGASGIVAVHRQAGWKVGICDLTEAEMSTNGNVKLRKQEAQRAADILGLDVRICLGLPDRRIRICDEQINKVVEVIRRLRPKIVLLPYYHDRHPDHEAGSQLVREAIFSAGLRKWKTSGEEEPHRVKEFYYYFINNVTTPDLIIDISEAYEKKEAALKAYESQFFQTRGGIATPINVNFLEMIKARDRAWGHEIGVKYGEALICEKPIGQKYLFRM